MLLSAGVLFNWLSVPFVWVRLSGLVGRHERCLGRKQSSARTRAAACVRTECYVLVPCAGPCPHRLGLSVLVWVYEPAVWPAVPQMAANNPLTQLQQLVSYQSYSVARQGQAEVKEILNALSTRYGFLVQ